MLTIKNMTSTIFDRNIVEIIDTRMYQKTPDEELRKLFDFMEYYVFKSKNNVLSSKQ